MAPKDTRYGLDNEDWDRLVEEITGLLVKHARRRETVTYADLAAEVTSARLHPHLGPLPALLEDVDRRSSAKDGVMLAAIVRHKGGDGMRGNRFFRVAEDLGREVGDRRAFWQAEVQCVFERYGRE